jgi:hypothetical protein
VPRDTPIAVRLPWFRTTWVVGVAQHYGNQVASLTESVVVSAEPANGNRAPAPVPPPSRPDAPAKNHSHRRRPGRIPDPINDELDVSLCASRSGFVARDRIRAIEQAAPSQNSRSYVVPNSSAGSLASWLRQPQIRLKRANSYRTAEFAFPGTDV